MGSSAARTHQARRGPCKVVDLMRSRRRLKPVRYLVSRRDAIVLRDHQQLADAGVDGWDRFAHHLAGSACGRRSPRIDGMMQKVQRWLQPSEIFRYAIVLGVSSSCGGTRSR